MTLPSGTVTFLLTDIEGSTRMTQALGDGWAPILARHLEILRTAVAGAGGTEFGTEGDALFAVFASAPRAVSAAVSAQRALAAEAWPPDGQIKVRMGLHTGEGTVSDDTYVGIDIHRAARITSAGHGGQVLISATARMLVDGQLPDGVRIVELGEYRLKDLARPEQIAQLTIEGLPAEFPPLRTLDATPNNLPPQLSSFLGREREIGEVRDLLTRFRLVTLTGPGGTGKTRLSLQVAAGAMEEFADGVYFVPLAAIRDPELFAPTVASVLGLPDRGGSAPMARLIEHLRERRVLLVFDNFEQLTEAAPLVGELLAGAPRVVALVTSRAQLRVYGEREYPLPPLGVPDPRHLPPLAALSQYEAVALFIDRARGVKPDFEVTNQNAPAVAEICARLDGLPLAIELAAARVNVLAPEAILGRLAKGLDLLSGGGRDRPERQQTLRGAIAWSFDLLTADEQELFCELGVFVGNASLEAIEAVSVIGEKVDLLEMVASLVSNSLLRQGSTSDGAPAFRMLETIREYAVERLREMGRWDDLADRHSRYFADLAQRVAGEVMGPDKRAVLDRIERDHDNIRSALERLTESGDAVNAMRLVAGLWRFWQMRGYLTEASAKVAKVLALPGVEEHPAELADALEAAGGLAWWRGDLEATIGFYERCLEVRRTLGDRSKIAEALYNLAFPLFPVAGEGGNVQRGRQLVDEAEELWAAEGDEVGVAKARWARGNLHWLGANYEESRAQFAEALPVFRAHGDSFQAGWTLYDMGLISVRFNDLDRARGELGEALRLFADVGDVSGYTLVLDAFAALAVRADDRETAARISGAVAALERRTGTGLNPVNRELVDFDPADLRTDPDTAAAWEEGSQLGPQEIVSYVLDRLDPLPSGSPPPKLPE